MTSTSSATNASAREPYESYSLTSTSTFSCSESQSKYMAGFAWRSRRRRRQPQSRAVGRHGTGEGADAPGRRWTRRCRTRRRASRARTRSPPCRALRRRYGTLERVRAQRVCVRPSSSRGGTAFRGSRRQHSGPALAAAGGRRTVPPERHVLGGHGGRRAEADDGGGEGREQEGGGGGGAAGRRRHGGGRGRPGRGLRPELGFFFALGFEHHPGSRRKIFEASGASIHCMIPMFPTCWASGDGGRGATPLWAWAERETGLPGTRRNLPGPGLWLSTRPSELFADLGSRMKLKV